MKIEVLGSGCKKCKVLKERVEEISAELSLTAEIVKVDDPLEIMGYGVMSTPSLVVDGKVMIQGKLPSHEELKALFS